MSTIPYSNLSKFTPPPFSNTYQTPLTQFQSLSSLSHFYNSFYNQTAKSVASVETLPEPQNFFYQNNISTNINQSSCYQQNQESYNLVDFSHYNPSKDRNMLVFGGNEANGSLISKIKQEELGFFQGFISKNPLFNENQGDQFAAFLDQKSNRDLANGQLECELEVVKDANECNYNSNGLLFSDENKTHHERGMYYYNNY